MSAAPPPKLAPTPTAKTASTGARRNWLVWIPLAIVLVMGAIFIWRLGHGGTELVQSRWINKPLPEFALPPATRDRPGVSSAGFRDGKPRLINIFASWCVPCRVEAPQLEALRARGVIIEGIAIRDRPDALAGFLAEVGNPYAGIGADDRSRVQIALGSSGVPETFLVDGNGIVRHQIQGVITDAMVPDIVAALQGME